jgi:serpin B
MGMPSAFTSMANFTGITYQDELYISKILHKTFIEVGEKGTEAAAATAVVMNLKSTYLKFPPEIIFNADHPFLFMIRDRETGLILFMGKIVRPTLLHGEEYPLMLYVETEDMHPIINLDLASNNRLVKSY